MADVAGNLYSWSTTASSNSPTDATTIGAGLADNLQEIQKVVRQDLATKGADIASNTTTDLGAVAGLMHDITGTTTITGLGTVSAGIWKIIKFEGVLTLTHNATSLILPTGANITTAVGDVAILMSEGSGNWRCLSYTYANGAKLEEDHWDFALGDETTSITTGTAKCTWYTPYAITLTRIPYFWLTTASSSGTPTVDINEGGTTILSTKLTVDANELTSGSAAAAAVLSDTSLAAQALITFDIDVAGTGAKGPKVRIFGRRT